MVIHQKLYKNSLKFLYDKLQKFMSLLSPEHFRKVLEKMCIIILFFIFIEK